MYIGENIYFTIAHCGKHQKTDIYLFWMSTFMTDIIGEQRLLLRTVTYYEQDSQILIPVVIE